MGYNAQFQGVKMPPVGARATRTQKTVVHGFDALDAYAFVQVGDDARIGMGAVVVTDVPAGEVWAGNPARPIRQRPTGALTPAEADGWEAYLAPLEAWPSGS